MHRHTSATDLHYTALKAIRQSCSETNTYALNTACVGRYVVRVEDTYDGLIYHSDIFDLGQKASLKTGEIIEGWVLKVRQYMHGSVYTFIC
jgi:hypothetical protein